MTLTPHFIPTDHPSRIWKSINAGICIHDEATTDFAQQLLLTSDEPPKNGQRYLSEGQFWTRQNRHKEEIYSEYKTVIAAYPPIQGIPNITDEDISYIVANPEKKVEAKMQVCEVHTFSDQCNCTNSPLIKDGFMQLIRPTEKRCLECYGSGINPNHQTICQSCDTYWNDRNLDPKTSSLITDSHPEPLFTKEDMEAAFEAGGESERQSISGNISEGIIGRDGFYFDEWLTTHQQK